jgi:activating signal cointegrator complex subunit 1
MPIGHHPALRERVTKFTDALCANSAAIPGMDKSIVIMPRRLRFTLGAMTLSGGAGDVPAKPHKSLAEAQEVLQSLQPRLLEMLAKAPSPGKLRVPLSRLDVVHPYHNNPRTVHSVFVGPGKEDAEYATFHAVASACSLLSTRTHKSTPRYR